MLKRPDSKYRYITYTRSLDRDCVVLLDYLGHGSMATVQLCSSLQRTD